MIAEKAADMIRGRTLAPASHDELNDLRRQQRGKQDQPGVAV